jgi:DNA-binding FrmR family transcriptional regulator
MDLPEDVNEDLRQQLHQVTEQVRELEQLMATDQDCRELVARLARARTDLEQAGFRLVSAAFTQCLRDEAPSAERAEHLHELEQLLLRLS